MDPVMETTLGFILLAFLFGAFFGFIFIGAAVKRHGYWIGRYEERQYGEFEYVPVDWTPAEGTKCYFLLDDITPAVVGASRLGSDFVPLTLENGSTVYVSVNKVLKKQKAKPGFIFYRNFLSRRFKGVNKVRFDNDYNNSSY